MLQNILIPHKAWLQCNKGQLWVVVAAAFDVVAIIVVATVVVNAVVAAVV